VENYIATTNVQEKFEVIFCLSTIKYIHLTFGDLGLKTLFLKAHTQLEDDGLLILDP
jgi:7SK snRNA methylphosphate capping enzyme